VLSLTAVSGSPTTAILSLFRVPSHSCMLPNKLIVHGNATATASNIAASETLFRAGIACNLLSEIHFMWVALTRYDLFKEVNQRQASVMLD